MAENKNTGKKPGRPKKTPVAEEVKKEDVFFDVPEEDQTSNTAEKAETGKENILSVNADDVTGIRYDGSEVPLTEVAPELAGETVEVHTETNKKAEPTFTMADVQKMAPMQIGKWGQLQEWIKDWDDPQDNHRHVSHLYALYPGNQITPEKTPY